ncbi:MAG TPA: GNAT family N-acetyltransferase [Pseudomonadota bacterium]|nr:GNAT family N-acetyltransferase [Pseudomonadota bacterium]
MSEDPPLPPYLVEAGDVTRDRETVLAVWRGNLGDPARMGTKYDWFYRDCPYGAPLLCILRHRASGAAVGVAAAGPRNMQAGGRALRAGVLVDMAVMPEHRSLGPALVLQQGLLEAAAQRFDLVYGFPNPKAVPVFKRVGYTQLADMVRYARVLRHARYLERRMPRLLARLAGPLVDIGVACGDAWRRRGDPACAAAWVERLGEDADALWAAGKPPAAALAVRDRTLLSWRFDRGPVPPTRYLEVRNRGDGTLRAWFACQVEDRMLHVGDYWSRDGANGAGRAAIEALLLAARRDGHVAVSVQLAGAAPALAGWLGAGFQARGSRPVYGRWFDRAMPAPGLQLTAADEDE